MRLQIFSDVHFDVASGWEACLADDVDVVVVPGDLCEGIERGSRWLRRHLGPDVAVVFIAGNHEYYNTVRPQERQHGSRIAEALGVTLLDDDEAVFGGVRFLGTTLWADFALFGDENTPNVMRLAKKVMLDHRAIQETDAGATFTPEDALAQHKRSRAWLERALSKPFGGPTVVVTHHAPHEKSVARKYASDMLTPAFVSDLAPLIERHSPALWVHGHTHVSFDYRVGATRVICNPHGYGTENPAFDPALVVEI